jgi:hypothetical protein
MAQKTCRCAQAQETRPSTASPLLLLLLLPAALHQPSQSAPLLMMAQQMTTTLLTWHSLQHQSPLLL